MTQEWLLVSKKDLKTLGIPYRLAHIALLEAVGKLPKRVQLGPLSRRLALRRCGSLCG